MTYDADADCPSRDEVVRRVAEKAPRARDARLTVRRGAHAFIGEVEAGGGASALERRVEGQTCNAVLDALVLVLALDRPPARAAEAAPPPPVPAERRPPAPVESTTTGRLEKSEQETAPQTVDHRSAIEIGIGIDSQLRSLAGRSVVGGALFVEVGAPRLLDADWYRPSLRVAGVYVAQPEGTNFYGTLQKPIDLLGGSVEACPLGVALVATRALDVAASTCGIAHLGRAGGQRSKLWVDAGVVARLTLQLGRKGDFRGFGALSGGLLGQLGEALYYYSGDHWVAQGGPMWSAALGGGLLLP